MLGDTLFQMAGEFVDNLLQIIGLGLVILGIIIVLILRAMDD